MLLQFEPPQSAHIKLGETNFISASKSNDKIDLLTRKIIFL